MEKTKYDIFISYRREGGDKYARTIQQALEKQYHVFLDFDELKDGVIDQRIVDAISESPVFLLILSKGALDRCVNENDWVRQEILQAAKSGCHIVPVTIDDTFDGFPASLPEELRRVVGQHQFSELQMKTLFKASMEQLVHDRIAPYIHREAAATGAEIHIETDTDCDMFRFKTFIRHLKAGEDNVVRLNPGNYKFEFVSTLYPDVRTSMIYSILPEMTCDFIEVELKGIINKEQQERDALEKLELHRVEKKGKYGFTDNTGTLVIPCKWKLAMFFNEGLAHVKDDNDKWGYIDKKGSIVIPCKWKDAEFFNQGVAHVQNENGEWVKIDKTGKVHR